MTRKRSKLNQSKIEIKWQNKWDNSNLASPDIKRAKKPLFNLWMFPYPSAEGLHAGHAFSSTGGDVYGRFMSMQGFDVFQPIGYDSFGIHSENFALSIKQHPEVVIKRTTKYYTKQLKSLGHAYDWKRTVNTSELDYYKWTQWLFIEMFKAGLAYRKEADVNWCPSCKTVLADEQVIHGECERCGNKVEIRKLEQWFFRITDYADRLLLNLKEIDWPEKIKIAQRNWIGKSKGATIKFSIYKSKFSIESFTTRPDTLYGATFFVLAPEHPKLFEVTTSKHKERVQKYINAAKKKSKIDRVAEGKEKTGVATGGFVINPATKKEIPVFVADYVLMEYGTGAIMGVPGHDQRDWEFAKVHKLKIKEVISGGDIKKEAYAGKGKIINSGKWNSIKTPRGIKEIIKDVSSKSWGKKTTSFHLRDWLISRQRYWGPPIPMIYCEKCAREGRSYFSKKRKLLRKNQSDWKHKGWWPEEKLPVELPHLADYQPKGTGRGPLNAHPEFFEVKCPQCGKKAKRETDVSDTFLDSSWYFLAYPMQGTKVWREGPSTSSGHDLLRNKIIESWLPVNLYFGGAEHAVLHLMYARFVTQVLHDLKLINFEEPFPRFYAHGLMIKDGAKMSKSKGNVVNPDEYIEKFGADTLRLYLMFMGPMDGYPDFRDTGIEGMGRFVERVWDLYENYHDVVLTKEDDCRELLTKMHQTIKKVSKDLENFHYNTSISAIMEFVNMMRDKAKAESRRAKGGMRCSEWDEALKVLAQILAPFTPHLAEEVWVAKLGEKYSIHRSDWPQFVPELIKDDVAIIAIQVNGKLRAKLEIKEQKSKNKDRIVRLAKAEDNVHKWLKGKKLKSTVFVPSRLVNFVTS